MYQLVALVTFLGLILDSKGETGSVILLLYELRTNNRIDAYGLILEHVLIFLHLGQAHCIAENSW